MRVVNLLVSEGADKDTPWFVKDFVKEYVTVAKWVTDDPRRRLQVGNEMVIYAGTYYMFKRDGAIWNDIVFPKLKTLGFKN